MSETLDYNPFLIPGIELLRAYGQLGHSVLEATLGPSIAALEATDAIIAKTGLDMPALAYGRRAVEATLEISAQLTEQQPKPKFGLNTTMIEGREVAVEEKVTFETDFCQVINFERQDIDRHDPKGLLFSAVSGHHATLHRDTVRALLPNADASITTWKYPEEVPQAAGPFGFAEYVDHAIDIMKHAGPDTHVMAICQPTVPVLAALSVMAETQPEALPLSVTLMGGPIDLNAAESKITDFVNRNDRESLMKTVIGKIGTEHAGVGRLAYPAEIQLQAFLAMNPMDHLNAHLDQWHNRWLGNDDQADRSAAFYQEYFAVFSLFADYYLDTFDMVFKEAQLANGTMTHRGHAVNPAAIKNLHLMTVEGGEDDISPPGHTTAAHRLCSGIPAAKQFHYLEPTAGHYGIFSGSKYRHHIAPRLRSFFIDAAKQRGITYTPPSVETTRPERWKVAA